MARKQHFGMIAAAGIVAMAAISSTSADVRAGTSPVGSAFTYQGLLNQGGSPYSGTADFQFTLWEQSAAGPQVGALFPLNAVVVTSGVFNASLNFGVLAFDGNERWLQIAVRTPAGGAGAFTTLSPRQRIDAVPYAMHALSAVIGGTQPNAAAFTNPANTYAGSSMSLDGGTLHVDAANNRVGVGTLAPEYPLHVGAPGGVLVESLGGGSDGFILRGGTTGPINAGVSLTTPGFGGPGVHVWLANYQVGNIVLATSTTAGLAGARVTVTPDGRVGIGNIGHLAAAKLHVQTGPAGVTPTALSTLALESNSHQYLNFVAPNGSEQGVLFGKPDVGAAAGAIIYNSAATLDGLQFRTNGLANRMTINSLGNVGVGLNNTHAQARLDVYNEGDTALNNTAVFRTATPGANISHVHHGAGGDWYIRSAINSGRVFIQDTPGTVNVGGGLTTHKLNVTSTNGDTLRLNANGPFGTQARIMFQDPGFAHIHNDTDGGLTIHSNFRLAMTGGNVGIGTTAPGTKLHIVNDIPGMNSLQSVNSAAAGTDVGSGVVGLTNQANVNAGGVRGHNSHTLGTGVIGTGNNMPATGFAFGSGGAFTGWSFGVFANSVQTGSSGAGVLAKQGAGEVYVAYWNGSTFYKINGTGLVSTIVKDVDDKPVTMFAPEAPEALLQDFGDGLLVNGFAHIDLDPNFAKNILVDPNHPMRVFIQLEGDENCQGVVVKNKTATGFDVVELRGGRTTTPFQYQITANRADEILPDGRLSKYADLRFPPAPEPAAVEVGAADPKVGQMNDQPQVRRKN